MLLELLEPVQTDASLPMVSSDGAIKVAFAVAKHKTVDYERYNPSGGAGAMIDVVSSEIHLELTNLTSDVVVVVWDLCSMALPDGKTTNVMHSGQRYITRLEPTRPTSIAPGGTLTDVLIPTSAVYYSEVWGWTVADRILDKGPFGVTLAIAVSGEVRYYNFKFLVGYSVHVEWVATSTQVEETTSSAQVGQMAPDFTLPSFIGSKVSLSDLRGKVVVLNFWASWCVPSRATMPGLKALVARYRDQGVVLVGVSLDRTAEEATAYLKESGSTQLVALWGSLAEARDVASRYNVFVSGGFGIPHTFIIDRQGIVRFSSHPATLTDETIRPWL